MAGNIHAFLRTRVSDQLVWAGRVLLLVPEAVLILVLLASRVVVHESVAVDLLASLLVVSFLARIAALYRARAAFEQARYEEADQLAQVAAMLYPWSADALALRGALALAHNQPEVAEVALQRAIRLLPGQAGFYAAWSSALLELGRPHEAAAAAHQALQIDPRSALAHLYLAEAERVLGTPLQQIEDRLRAGLATSNDVTATAALHCALAGHLLTERRFAEATLALHAAEALLPRCSVARQAELRFHMGELCNVQGQPERAREHFQGVEALDPQGRYAAAAWRAARL